MTRRGRAVPDVSPAGDGDPRPPLAAQARQRYLAGDVDGAVGLLGTLISEVTGIAVRAVTVNADEYSLNSVNGRVELVTGDRYFYKFHSEEGEESTIAEYYNAEMLRSRGYDIDVPEYSCGEPGRQILLYRLRTDARMADVCREIDFGSDPRRGSGHPDAERVDAGATAEPVVAAQIAHDRSTAERLIESLHVASGEEIAAEPIHQLFWNRLVSPSSDVTAGFGGRVARFYTGSTFRLGGGEGVAGATVSLDWPTLRDAAWVVNGIEYEHTLGELFVDAGVALDPAALTGAGAVVAHGDEHNANVWFERGGGNGPGDGGESAVPRLVSFDPAFAGPHIPALLADVKATFHNVHAHPFWLYEPDEAARRYTASVRFEPAEGGGSDTRLRSGTVVLDHDFSLSALRLAFSESKSANLWRPLVGELGRRGLLPDDWERVVRLAMFCCPTLVLDLTAGGINGHNPVSSAIGLAQAVAAGSAPRGAGADDFTRFFDAVRSRTAS
jgi:hypothetical protein